MSASDPLQEPTAELAALASALGTIPPPCRVDPEAFYAPQPERAVALCRDCHGRLECLALAEAVGEQWGVWGGRSFERRPSPQLSPSLRQRAS